MPTTLSDCDGLLSQAGIRHHLDADDDAIRLVFVTCHYENPRGEKLAIVQVETPDGGRRVRVSIVRAFCCGDDAAATCLALCRLAAGTPLVGVEYDPRGNDLRLVAETAIEDGRLTRSQLLAMIDGVVEAAEAWQAALWTTRRRSGGKLASA